MKKILSKMAFFKKFSFIKIFIATLCCFLFAMILISFSNFIFYKTPYKVSDYDKFEKTILVDVSTLISPGGIYTLSANLVYEIAKKRPNWKFLVMHREEDDYLWKHLGNEKNIQSFHIIENNTALITSVFFGKSSLLDNVTDDIRKFPTKIKRLWGKIKFFLLYSRWLPDISMFFDPVSTLYINEFYLPRVSVIHDLLYNDLPKLSFSPYYAKRSAEATAKYSDAIITISNFSKQKILNLLNIDQEKVHMIHTQLSKRLHNIDHNNDKILKQKGLIKNQYIVYPSAFWPHKNQKNLIKAFLKFYKTNNNNMKLVLVGSAPPELINKIVCDNIKNSVIITNFVSNSDLKALIDNSIAVIFPSLYEGFGMGILEGMVAGKPVACSNVASIPEIGGDAVLYFDPYDIESICNAIREITTNHTLRESLIKKGYERIKKFSNKNWMIDQYIAVMESVLGK